MRVNIKNKVIEFSDNKKQELTSNQLAILLQCGLDTISSREFQAGKNLYLKNSKL